MQKRITSIVLLSTIFLVNNVYAGNPEDWIIMGNGPIIDGQSYSLYSEDQKGSLRYKDRQGVNLGWSSGGNGYMKIAREKDGDKPLKCGESFALFIEKEWVMYEKQTFGINLSTRTRNNSYYQWTFDCSTGEVPTNQPIVLKNKGTAIVGCRRAVGVNLCWAGDVITLPAVGNVREADKDKIPGI